jgi:GDPmannose 4,6-dehydratase
MSEGQKKAVVSGIGQDASYLSELLLSKDYEVWAIARRSTIPKYDNIEHLIDNPNFHVVEGDLTDPSSMRKIVDDVKPDEFYNTAAMSHVKTSFEQPALTFAVNTVGVLNILEAIRECSKKTRFISFNTSEMFGNNYSVNSIGMKFQNEDTSFAPRSPYGVSKLAAHELIKVYRESYNLWTSSVIMFNHESERRGHNFVTRKITRWLGQFYAKYLVDNQADTIHRLFPSYPVELPDREKLRLGNVKAYRDFGYAMDYMEAVWLIMQQEEPETYVLSTGETHTIEDFLDLAFKTVDERLDWRDYVVIDQAFYRPNEVDYLCGSSRKIRQKLNWKPKVTFEKLVERMVYNDMGLAVNGK